MGVVADELPRRRVIPVLPVAVEPRPVERRVEVVAALFVRVLVAFALVVLVLVVLALVVRVLRTELAFFFAIIESPSQRRKPKHQKTSSSRATQTPDDGNQTNYREFKNASQQAPR